MATSAVFFFPTKIEALAPHTQPGRTKENDTEKATGAKQNIALPSKISIGRLRIVANWVPLCSSGIGNGSDINHNCRRDYSFIARFGGIELIAELRNNFISALLIRSN